MRRALEIGLVLAVLTSAACGDSTAVEAGPESETGSESETGEQPDPRSIERIEGAHGAVCAYEDNAATACWGLLPSGTDIGLDEPMLPFEHVEVIGVACGLHQGTVYCWGRDYGFGLLGYGLAEDDVDLEQALERGGVEIGEPIVMLDSGTHNHVVAPEICALADSGQVYCWGLTKAYPGIMAVGDDETPADVGPISLGDEAVWVDVGGQGACAKLKSGEVRCWGSAALTGGWATGFDEAPTDGPLLDLGAPIHAVSVGDDHACAIVGEGQVKCWGNGLRAELGRPGVFGAVPSAELEPVELPGPAVEIAARIQSSCARLESGAVYCWGTGQYGQHGHPWAPACEVSSDPEIGFSCSADPSCCIGDDETPQSAGPVELPGPARDLVGTSNGPCVLLDSGAVHCWGAGYSGLIGDALTPDCFDELGWSCGHDPACCVGDDETPAAANRPVIFE